MKCINSRIAIIKSKKRATVRFLKKDMANLLASACDDIAYGRVGSLPSSLRLVQRKIPSLVQSKFLRLDYVSFRDRPGIDDLKSRPLNFETCKSTCLGNASCVAFSYKYTGKQDCVILYNQLIDGYWSPATELATFLRVSSSETDESTFTAMISMIETVCPVRVSLPVPPKASKTTARNVGVAGDAGGSKAIVPVPDAAAGCSTAIVPAPDAAAGSSTVIVPAPETKRESEKGVTDRPRSRDFFSLC